MSDYVLGVNWYAHDASAALARDGRIVFAVAEERLSRVKKDNQFPRRAIQAALSHAGITFADLDAVAFGWNAPFVTPLQTLKLALTGRLPLSTYVQSSFAGLVSETHRLHPLRQLERHFGPFPRSRVSFIDHHLAHAYSTYHLSGFPEAMVLIVDGRGAHQATSLYHGEKDELTLVRMIPYPNSIGLLYEAFTDLLGFERHNDEWKVMGLAAYGQPRFPMDEFIRITDGSYEVRADAVSGRYATDIAPLVARLGPRRQPGVQITDEDRDLAASVQRATEEALFALVRDARRRIPSGNLCLAGGVAMNSKANGRLLASGLIERVFIQPAATDDGTAVGAALAGHHALTGRVSRYELKDVYLGAAATPQEIECTLRTCKIPFVRTDRATRIGAELLARGRILGWFQGRMEFGPRALGNRSILADARDAAMKDKVNEVVKFREGWRPFAPSVLVERFAEYFEPEFPSPYMILTHTVRPEKRQVIPAVTHADGTARIQTVDRAVNPRYWELISEFEKLTGVAVIMNTSFNLKGEPIVNDPRDAIRTFYSSGLDFLVLGDCIVAKHPSALAELGASG